MSTVIEDMNAIAHKILEEWAMMLVEPLEDWESAFVPGQPYFVGQLEFRGLISGKYSVICQEDFARSLAVNLLGSADEVGEAQMQDAVREMINVLSGNLLTSSYGEDAVFDLTSPDVHMCTQEEVAKLMEGYHMCYMADDQPVAVTFNPERA